MKLPNGYGSISQMKDRPRRKPWRVRITEGWDDNGKIKSKTLGYYATRVEAIKALADFHENPYSIEQTITFAELYEKWAKSKFITISHSNELAYKASFSYCEPIHNMQFVKIRTNHLQNVIDKCGKNYPTLRKLKVLLNQLYRFAMQNDVCNKDYSQFVDIAKHKEHTEEKHKPFTDAEINILWQETQRNEYISIILMLLYSGVRISELLDLKKENVYLEERYFDVIESKTDAGIRKVPIADRTMPFFKAWMQNESNYLICNNKGKKFIYSTYMRYYWSELMKELNFDHLPHDTRHTTISLLAKAEVNPTIIKRIVGHAGAMDLTEKVYTHFDVQQLIDAINKI